MRTKRDLLSERLRRQHVYPSCTLTSPAEVVAWFGGVQSQDYGGAKWAVDLEVTTFAPIPKTASRYVTKAADRYGAFLGLTPRLRIT